MTQQIQIESDLSTQTFLRERGRTPVSSNMLKGDLGSRQFWRLRYADGRSEIMMVSLPECHPNFTPGHRLEDYISLAKQLREYGLHAPEIREYDLQAQLCLIEDFGDMTFLKALDNGYSSEDLTRAAGKVLKILQNIPAKNLPDFMSSHIMKGHKRFVDWYCPVLFGRQMSDAFIRSYLDVWEDILASMPAPEKGFVYLDFHFGNLMLLENGETGLLDFQGAMNGPVVYDLTNLLQDARRDIDQRLHDEILNIVMDGKPPEQKESFKLWYDVLACQFHCRVIGQFIKLAKLHGKSHHLEHLPRLARYIDANTQKHAVLKPLRQWLDNNDVDLTKDVHVDLSALDSLIRNDAI